MFGIPKYEIKSAMERGYSAEVLEQARQLLVRAYYRAFLARGCGDTENTGSIIHEETCIDGHRFDWQAMVFNDEYMDRDGALLWNESDDNNTEVVLDLSYVELWHLCKASLH